MSQEAVKQKLKKLIDDFRNNEDAQGFPENKNAAQRGGKVAGNARQDTEKELGRTIVSQENYLEMPEKIKRKLLK